MKFSLLGKNIEISEGCKNYMEISSHFDRLAAEATNELKNDYENKFSSIIFDGNFCEKIFDTYGTNQAMDTLVKKYVVKTREYLTKYGVYTLSDDYIWSNAICDEERTVSELQYAYNTTEDSLLFAEDGREPSAGEMATVIRSKFDGGVFSEYLIYDIMALCDFVIDYVNDNKLAPIQYVYKDGSEKAKAIFQNLTSIDVADTEKEKLALSLIEYNFREKEYYEYIFEKFPHARVEISRIAQYLHVDIMHLIEEELISKYSVDAISSEEDALKMRENLKKEMAEYNITTCVAKSKLDKVINDYAKAAVTYDGVVYASREIRAKAEKDDKEIELLYKNILNITKEDCNRIISEIKNSNYVSEIRNKHIKILMDICKKIDIKYLEELTSDVANKDESECNKLCTIISEYDSEQDVKAKYMDIVTNRITEIWDKEDFEKFLDIYINTPVSSSEQIGKNCTIIRNIGRTNTKDLFIKALYFLNETEIDSAAKYAVAKENGKFFSMVNMNKKSSYDILTINGKVIHPALENAIKKIKKEKENSFIGKLFKGQNPLSTSPKNYCKNCGEQIDGGSKFCPNCGSKQ